MKKRPSMLLSEGTVKGYLPLLKIVETLETHGWNIYSDTRQRIPTQNGVFSHGNGCDPFRTPRRSRATQIVKINAGLDDFCCPRATGCPSWEGQSLEWPDNFDHYGLGQWCPVAEEFMEDELVGYLGMGFEAPAEEGPQGDDGWDGSFEGIDLLAEGFQKNSGEAVGEDTFLQDWEWPANPVELEVPQEEGAIPMGSSTSTSTLPPLSSTNNDMTSSNSPEEVSDTQATLSSKDTPSGDEWSCDFANCGKRFSHRHKLNRHKKYHLKPYRCLDPLCSARGIGFSLNKDLVRHQSQHSGQRYYCPNRTCNYALGGGENGFSRQDNLKRHIKTRH
ncbi:hypothetical protein V8E51_014787 [Hyaloscypha variabilis]